MAVADIPSGRAAPVAVESARAAVLAEGILIACIDAMPCLVMVLNEQRQILAANAHMLRAMRLADAGTLVGRRPGEAVGCLRSGQGADGCGSGDACALCGATEAMVTSQRNLQRVRRDARLLLAGAAGQALDLEVTASPLDLAGRRLVLVAMRDVADEQRRRALERTFFHDVLNTASGINSLARLAAVEADAGQRSEFEGLLATLSEQMVEEIKAQAALALAENGDLAVERTPVEVAELLAQVHALYANHPAAQGRTLRLGEVAAVIVHSDRVLLRRILGNLVKNALEATPVGGVATVSARMSSTGAVAFEVHNPGVIPPEAQRQLFQRGFSTKGVGRGLGTYSARLLGERYLGGAVSFASSPRLGTVVTFALPSAAAG